MTRPGCLDAATLASFIDGHLPAERRVQVEDHLASCAACRRAWWLTESVLNEVDPDRASAANRPTRGRSKTRWWIGIGAAAAILLAVVLWRPFGLAFTTDQRIGKHLATLATESRTTRPSAGRLAGPFGYAERPSASRSANARREVSGNADAAIGSLNQIVTTHRTARALAAAGVGRLMRGEIEEAISVLEESVRLAPAIAETHVHLAAAYLDRFALTDQPIDANRALDHADTALSLGGVEAAGRFNRAMAIEALGLRDDAIRAWERVRDAEPGSGWAREAADHIEKLSRGRSSGSPETLAAASQQSIIAAAKDAPWMLHRAVDAALDAWANAVLEDRAEPIPAWLTGGTRALRHAGRDRLSADLLEAAGQTDASSRQVRCVATVVQAHAASDAAFDRSDYRAAAEAAQRAIDAAPCAGLSSLPFAAQRARSHYYGFPDLAPAAVTWARGSAGDIAERGYLRAAGRMQVVSALAALRAAYISDGLATYKIARDLGVRAGDADLMATAQTGLVETFTNSGDLDQAWVHQRRAFELLPELTQRRRHLVLTSGASLALRSTPASSLTFARLVVSNSLPGNNPAFVTGGRLSVARALARLGRVSDAEAAVATARSSLDAIQAADERRRFGVEIDFVNGQLLLRRDPHEAVRALAALGSGFAGPREPEFQLLRARAHRAIGDLDGARDALLKGLALMEDQGTTIRDSQLRVSRLSDLWDLFGDLIDLTASDATASLAIAERSRQRGLLDSIARDRTIDAVAQPPYVWLPEDVTVLAYATLRDRLLVWRVTRAGVDVLPHNIGRDALQRLVASHERAIVEGRPSAAADELAAYLLPAGLPAGRNHRLVFLPDGPLYSLPFSTLPYDKTLVVQAFIPIAAPSLSALAHGTLSAESAVAAGGRPLFIGYGEANATADLPALPGVDRELEELRSVFAASRPDVMQGQAATRAAILKAMPASPLVHFAGHARADDVYPGESRLFVASDQGTDAISATDISGLGLRPGTLVVVEGCSTASGRLYRGEGAMTIARAFLLGGASTVVANFWLVNDRASTYLMTEFYRRLAAGERAPVALAGMQRAAIARGDPIVRWANLSVISKTLR